MQQSTPEQVATYLSRLARGRDISQLLWSSGAESVSSSEGGNDLQQRATEGVQRVLSGGLPTADQTAGLEAIILPKIRPVLEVVDGDFHTDHPLWVKLNNDAAIRGALRSAIPSIGRIELPGNAQFPYGGTGFVVGAGLVMTNRHVAAIFSSGVGSRVTFRPGQRAGVDFVRELDRQTGPTFAVTGVVMVHPFWDMALLKVEGLPASAKPLRLASSDASIAAAAEVAAIGYPAFDTRNDVGVQNDLFRRVFGVKRLQPGTLDGRSGTESFGKIVTALRHNCSTLGGNSGSALVDFATGLVVALHFGGRFADINYGVPATELAKDPRVVDAGVQFAPAAVVSGQPSWADWWTRANESAPVDDPADASPAPARPAAPARVAPANVDTGRPVMSDGAVDLVVPLHITIRIGSPAASSALSIAAPQAAREPENVTEKLVMPFHEEDYETRSGYDPKFLGVKIPMPDVVDPSVVAAAKDGSTVLHYQNFSIVMHAQRRLALYTASNVTAEPAVKKPEAGRQYTRRALSGLGPSDQEKWFPDPRLDDAFQLSDVFYTRDDGAFDKGHIVRREDVAWGTTFDSLRRANGDTYHVTNCSPQVAAFNQGARGVDNWGDLEDHVLKGAATERYCQFAGPVLDPADETFIGKAAAGKIARVKIPSRFWKVIVTQTADGLASYGFLLEQDLSNVPFEEFIVSPGFKPFMEPLIDLQERIGIRFPDAVVAADQHNTTEGIEVAMRAGATRRSRAAGVVVEGALV